MCSLAWGPPQKQIETRHRPSHSHSGSTELVTNGKTPWKDSNHFHWFLSVRLFWPYGTADIIHWMILCNPVISLEYGLRPGGEICNYCHGSSDCVTSFWIQQAEVIKVALYLSFVLHSDYRSPNDSSLGALYIWLPYECTVMFNNLRSIFSTFSHFILFKCDLFCFLLCIMPCVFMFKSCYRNTINNTIFLAETIDSWLL